VPRSAGWSRGAGPGRSCWGLLAELPRKNCRTIAGHAGDRTPDGMQHLLSRARWDAGGVRDDVGSYVVEQLGDPGAVLAVDETGDVKKGHRHAGGAAAVHRHRGPDRERPGRGLPWLVGGWLTLR
jgi:SRSO17 transposase